MYKDIRSYVIITPARNEAQFIELVLQSVIAQSVHPLKWIIVSDGSTDGTDQIVERYALKYPWIELVRAPERKERHFAGKVQAFNAGYSKLKDLDYRVLISLDADISFTSDYFEFLLMKLEEDPELGLVGTPFKELSGESYDYRFTSVEHVSGACQVFRRECFETIGGYTPIKGGGVDLVAVITARMRGWRTRTYPEKVCTHHRMMNSAINKGLNLKFKWGQSDYRLGSHPAWQLFRCLYQMSRPPYVVGGLATLSGYCFAFALNHKRAVSQEFSRFRGQEQMRRLKDFIFGVPQTARE